MIRNFCRRVSVSTKNQFDLHRIKDGPETTVDIPLDVLNKMYYDMIVMRRMESAADQLYKQKMIRGFCHLNTGQEAISVGMENALDRKDAIITAYRCHGFAYMRGGTVSSILGELMGRKTGITKGKGGSMHMFAENFYGGNGIVGAQVPLGAGMAFAQKYRKEQSVTFALYGDGAANQGQVFEAYNMAKLWDLPCIFACENNGYGMGTSAKRSSASTDYYSRGDYVPGIRVDGMDVISVYSATKFAKEYVLKNGPLVFEFATYRYAGHSMSDPGTTYRTREEVGQVRELKDPITRLKSLLLELGQEEEIKKMDKNAKQHVTEAIEAATAAPEPDVHEMYTEVYVEKQKIRGLEPEEIN